MSLDPKTLKKGDIVVFRGKVNAVIETTGSSWLWLVIEGHVYYFGLEHPIWQIADLEKPTSVETGGGLEVVDDGSGATDSKYVRSIENAQE
jgi:hypothetical protein